MCGFFNFFMCKYLIIAIFFLFQFNVKACKYTRYALADSKAQAQSKAKRESKLRLG